MQKKNFLVPSWSPQIAAESHDELAQYDQNRGINGDP
jgi:hypothetical protein